MNAVEIEQAVLTADRPTHFPMSIDTQVVDMWTTKSVAHVPTAAAQALA
jgi:hypothetical protein